MSHVVVRALVPLLRVKSVPISIEFYAKLGFTVANTFVPEGATEPQWASLVAGDVEIMLGTSEAANGACADAFYLYTKSVDQFHAQAEQAGLTPTPIIRPFFNPGGEFELTDPDGHSVYVAMTGD